jgi:hypothetical protein
MVIRTALSVFLCIAAMGVGIATVVLASKNRARRGELDVTQRWCETMTRQDELDRKEIAEREWRLLSGEPEPVPVAAHTGPVVPEVQH